ncbi:MAG: YqgE/AlgH family protein [Pseudomonadales bacterium]|nr:YqgE/AlgH family protein [Pseudomonadales bacterium]
MSNEATSLQHHFLIAMPHMQDPNFSGTVTYICDHNEHGALGVVINRPLDITLAEIFDQLEMAGDHRDDVVFAGGPVQVDRGFVLHKPAGDWQATMPIQDEVCLTTSKDILRAYARDEGPEDCLIALGYSGWGAGQLEQEIMANCWLTCPADENILFHMPFSERFDAAVAKVGIDLSNLSQFTGHA